MQIEHKVWRADAKMNLANERTLIAWVRVGSTFGAGAVIASHTHAQESGNE